MLKIQRALIFWLWLEILRFDYQHSYCGGNDTYRRNMSLYTLGGKMNHDLPDFKSKQELHEFYLLNPDLDFIWYRNTLLNLGNEEKGKPFSVMTDS